MSAKAFSPPTPDLNVHNEQKSKLFSYLYLYKYYFFFSRKFQALFPTSTKAYIFLADKGTPPPL